MATQTRDLGDRRRTERRVNHRLADITLPELRVLAKTHGPMALVQLDSHTDTWEAYFGQRYFHGTTFKRAAEEGLIVLGKVVEGTLAADLKVGMEMELTSMPLFVDDDGVERIVYAWRIAS